MAVNDGWWHYYYNINETVPFLFHCFPLLQTIRNFNIQHDQPLHHYNFEALLSHGYIHYIHHMVTFISHYIHHYIHHYNCRPWFNHSHQPFSSTILDLNQSRLNQSSWWLIDALPKLHSLFSRFAWISNKTSKTQDTKQLRNNVDGTRTRLSTSEQCDYHTLKSTMYMI